MVLRSNLVQNRLSQKQNLAALERPRALAGRRQPACVAARAGGRLPMELLPPGSVLSAATSDSRSASPAVGRRHSSMVDLFGGAGASTEADPPSGSKTKWSVLKRRSTVIGAARPKHDPFEFRSTLTDFCATAADHAMVGIEIANSVDVVRMLAATVASDASALGAAAATAIAVVMVPTREHAVSLEGGASVEAATKALLQAHTEEATSMCDAKPTDRLDRLLKRNYDLDIRCAAAARQQHGAPEWSGKSERCKMQLALRDGGALGPLVQMLKGDQALTRCAGAHAIRNATDHNEVVCDAVREAGGLALLHELLTGHYQSDDAGRVAAREEQHDAFFTLDHAAAHEREMAMEKKADSESFIARRASRETIMERRGSGESFGGESFSMARGGESFIAARGTGSADRDSADAEAIDEATQFWSLACLGNLAISNDANRNAIHQLDIIPLLVNIATDASHQANAQAETTGGSTAHQQAETKFAQAGARTVQLEAAVTAAAREMQREVNEAMSRGLPPVPSRRAADALARAQDAVRAARVEAKAAGVEARAQMVATWEAQEAEARRVGLAPNATPKEIKAAGGLLDACSGAPAAATQQKGAAGGSSAGSLNGSGAGAGQQLAILAGEVLSSLLAKGGKQIEIAIVSGIVDAVSYLPTSPSLISAHISLLARKGLHNASRLHLCARVSLWREGLCVLQVRTQGAQAPVAFPELMAVLQVPSSPQISADLRRSPQISSTDHHPRTSLPFSAHCWKTIPTDMCAGGAASQAAARERLQKVVEEADAASLHLALDFGRWIKLPAILLGQARNHFKDSTHTARPRPPARVCLSALLTGQRSRLSCVETNMSSRVAKAGGGAGGGEAAPPRAGDPPPALTRRHPTLHWHRAQQQPKPRVPTHQPIVSFL